MRRRILANAVALLVGTAACVLMGEGIVRALQLAGRMQRVSVENEPSLDTRATHAELNAALIPSPDPLLGWEPDPHDPNVNTEGMRDGAVGTDKPPDVFRIAVLGDSYAYGFSVPAAVAFPSQLGALLSQRSPDRKIEVLNFGVIGYGSTQELELYKTKVRRFHPDLVLLAYVLNDPAQPDDVRALLRSLGASRERLRRLATYSQFLAWTYARLLRFQSEHFGVWATYRLDGARGRQALDALRELQRLTAADGIALAVVVFPVFTPYRADYPFATLHADVDAFFAQQGVPYLDLLPVYGRQHLAEFHLSDGDAHPNARGHQVAAESIARFLTERALLRPR
jgi:lysophospholipase L1-like esterase